MKHLLLAAALAAAWLTGTAAADTYPSRAITITVPYGAGGTNDILARAIANKISPALGQPVLVVNQAGAGGNIGAHNVAKAKPDGYTLLLASSGVFSVNKWLYDNLDYDPATAFAPIVLAGSVPNILLAYPGLPVTNVQELVAYARANPGKLNFASMGSGTSGHLAAELFKLQTGIQAQHVAYRGSAPALNDMLGGHVQLMFDNFPTALPQVKGARLKALAVSSSERAALLPEVPTVAESGAPGFNATAWFGIAAPAGTPAAIVEQLNQEIVKAMQDPSMQEVMAAQGVSFKPNTPAQFKAFIDAESIKWKKVVQTAGIKAD